MRALPASLVVLASSLLTACASAPAGRNDEPAVAMVQTSTSILSTGQANSGISTGMTSIVVASATRIGATAELVFNVMPTGQPRGCTR